MVAPKAGTEKKTAVAHGGDNTKDEIEYFFKNTRFIGDEEVKTTSEPQRQPPAVVQHSPDTAMTHDAEEVKSEVPNEQTDDAVPPKP